MYLIAYNIMLFIYYIHSSQAHVDEKIKFLTDHHHDLLNQRAALDAKLKEIKAQGRETVAQHVAAEVSRVMYICLIFDTIFCAFVCVVIL